MDIRNYFSSSKGKAAAGATSATTGSKEKMTASEAKVTSKDKVSAIDSLQMDKEQISPNIKENALQHTVNWYFSLENVQAANDAVIKLMDRMELPNIYRRSQDTLHTASDGQKFEVRSESLNANYSFKYFGKGQGASAYTFIDERNLLWHSLVFSASERESAYVVDGLMRNDVIKSDIHSTDTHGYSEAIFATTHMLGFPMRRV